MAVVSHDNRIRSLNHRVLESLLHPAVADVGENSGARTAGISTVETQSEQPWPASIRVCDPELCAQVSDRAVELGAVMQLDVVDAEAKIVQQIRAEGVAPVDHVIVDWRVREAGAQQGKRTDRRVVLLGMRIAAEDVVVVGGVEIDLYVVLVGVDQPGLSVAGIVLRARYRSPPDKETTRTSACATGSIGSTAAILLLGIGALPLNGS